MESIIASYGDENSRQINIEKHKSDYVWIDEMLEMKDKVKRLNVANPVRDIYGGLPTEYANLVSDTINKPLQGKDWYSVRDEAFDVADLGVNGANDAIAKL